MTTGFRHFTACSKCGRMNDITIKLDFPPTLCHFCKSKLPIEARDSFISIKAPSWADIRNSKNN